MTLKELLKQRKSVILCAHPSHYPTLTQVVELFDAYKGDPMYKYRDNGVIEELTYPVIEWSATHIASYGISLLHREWWKQVGKWEKGQPKTEWYKQPIPVRIVENYTPTVEGKLLHTLRDSDGTILYVLETTPNTRPEYWLVYA